MMTEQKNLRVTTRKIEGDSLTPILIFRRLKGNHKFLLESSSQAGGSGRYSFIGLNPRKSLSWSGWCGRRDCLLNE